MRRLYRKTETREGEEELQYERVVRGLPLVTLEFSSASYEVVPSPITNCLAAPVMSISTAYATLRGKGAEQAKLLKVSWLKGVGLDCLVHSHGIMTLRWP